MKYLIDTDYILKITGKITGSDEDQILWNYIVDNNLENKIEFTGFVQGEKLQKLVRGAVCIVCPAIWYENMPNTVMEAYAYGKPVVASRIGSLAEMVEGGVTGRLLTMKDDEELSRILREFINDKELSARLGKNARIKCECDYSVNEHMIKVLNLLNGQDIVQGDYNLCAE